MSKRKRCQRPFSHRMTPVFNLGFVLKESGSGSFYGTFDQSGNVLSVERSGWCRRFVLWLFRRRLVRLYSMGSSSACLDTYPSLMLPSSVFVSQVRSEPGSQWVINA